MVSTSGTVNETLILALEDAVDEIRYMAFETPDTENCSPGFRRAANKKMSELLEIIGKARTGRLGSGQTA